MNPQLLMILSITVASFFCALVWVIFYIRRSGRSFHVTVNPSKGVISRRIDFDLIEDVLTQSLTFSGFVFVVVNFIIFIITDEWSFGLNTAKGTLIAILVYIGIKIVKDLYTFAVKACEEAIPISEVEKKKEKRDSD